MLVLDEPAVAFLLGGDLSDGAWSTTTRTVLRSSPPPGRDALRADLARALAERLEGTLVVTGPDAEQVLAHAWAGDLVVIDAAEAARPGGCPRARLVARLTGALAVLQLSAEPTASELDAIRRLPGDEVLSVVLAEDADVARTVCRGYVSVVRVPPLSVDERLSLWRACSDDPAVDELAHRWPLSAAQIATAGRSSTLDEAADAARAGFAADLGPLAQELARGPRWDDLVVPDATRTMLHSMTGLVRHRRIVLHKWGFGAAKGIPVGLTALFHGPSGTGKTFAARVIAGELGLTAYRVDLSAVVSKCIGETEKQLGRLFDIAQRANAVLVFDEADALFGKRSGVTDARDRYANLAVAYLLQRLEAHDGPVILTTNLRQNIDLAFLRRLDFAVEFPMPDATQRRSLWSVHRPQAAPFGDEVSFDRLAQEHELSGGSIANCLRLAAFAAAESGRVGVHHLDAAIAMELRKLGRLPRAPASGRVAG